jgi:hypothetical protein
MDVREQIRSERAGGDKQSGFGNLALEHDVSRQSLAAKIGFGFFVALTAAVYFFYFGIGVGLAAGFGAEEIVHGISALLYTAIVLTALAMGWSQRMYFAGFWSLIAAATALLAVLVIVGNPDNHGGQAGPFDVAYLIFVIPLVGIAALHPRRRALRHGGRALRGRLLALAVAFGVPGLIYAVDQALMQRNSWPPNSDPHHNAHWLSIATLGAALVLMAVLATFLRNGWHLPAAIAAVGGVVFGAVSILFPDTASSPGVTGGLVALIGGLAFGLESRRLFRHDTQTASRYERSRP